MKRRIVLWGVPPALRYATAEIAKEAEIEVSEALGELSGLAWGSDVSVAVLGGCHGRNAQERVRAARKQFRDALLVVLLPRRELAIVPDLASLPSLAVMVPDRPAHTLAAELVELAKLPDGRNVDALGGVSLATWILRGRIAAAAASDFTVLLLGETGTGKTAAARAIHTLSERRQAPFVTLDCAALSPTLVESELFGHEKGSFTGAVGRRAGRFEVAGEGTILLDEIGDLPPSLQAKFLRVLEERRFERVGGVASQPMRARVIAATHVDLDRAAPEGRFRVDLYYRLRVYSLRIPPLRERPQDILVIAMQALHQTAAELGRPVPSLAPSFTQRLLDHPWPGNVRELLHTVETALLHAPTRSLGGSSLDGFVPPSPAETVPDDLRSGAPAVAADDSNDAERSRLARELVAAGGNIARMARRLGVPYSTARGRIRRLGLTDLIPRD